jgi:hypothetical protein
MGHADDIEHNLVILIYWQSGGRRRAFPAACAASAALFTHSYMLTSFMFFTILIIY